MLVGLPLSVTLWKTFGSWLPVTILPILSVGVGNGPFLTVFH